MKNIKTFALLIIAVVVVGAGVILANVTDFKVEDAFAAARIVKTGGNDGEIYFTKAPAPKPAPSKPIVTIPPILTAVGIVVNKPTPKPTTASSNTTRPSTATGKTVIRTGTVTTPAIQPRTDNPPAQQNPGVQPVKSPATPPVQAKTPYKIVCPDNYEIKSGRCVSKCTSNNILTQGSCGVPKCKDGYVLNLASKDCVKPVTPTCSGEKVIKDGKCVDKQQNAGQTCTTTGLSKIAGTPCCSGLDQYGRCVSAIVDPGHVTPLVPPIKPQPVQGPSCPPPNRWCKEGEIFNFGIGNKFQCLETQISVCGTIKTLIPYAEHLKF